MTVSQEKFREIVFQLLFSFDVGQPTHEEMLKLMMKELSVTKNTVRQALERTDAVRSKLREIDPMIQAAAAKAYEFARIQLVEKNILRLALFELCFDEKIPPKVAINEAMRLAKKFSTPESALFVNAILDAIYKGLSGVPVDETRVVDGIAAMEGNEKIINEVLQDQRENTHAKRPEPDLLSDE